MWLFYTSLALLLAVAASGNIVFPGPTSHSGAMTSNLPQTKFQPATLTSQITYQPAATPSHSDGPLKCPFPPPEGTTLETLDMRCYRVTDEEDMIMPLIATDSQCAQGYVLRYDRCMRIALLNNRRKAPSKNRPRPLLG